MSDVLGLAETRTGRRRSQLEQAATGTVTE